MILQDLHKKGLIDPPNFVLSNTAYLTIAGSNAYGVADTSVKDGKIPDFDIYGFCIPSKDMIFPHLRGEIQGFGTPGPSFDQWQKAHILDATANGGKGKEWDFQIFSIVKYFELCRENNPNMIDSLYTPQNCIIHTTEVGQLVRDNRHLFLSKLAWKKFRGYAWSQMHKMKNKSYAEIVKFEQANNVRYPDGTDLEAKRILVATRIEQLNAYWHDEFKYHEDLDQWIKRSRQGWEWLFGKNPFTGNAPELPANPIFGNIPICALVNYQELLNCIEKEGKRKEIVEQHGYDVKFAYHLIRLLDEAEQIMLEGTIDLQRAREPMKAIRRGEWKEEDIYSWAMEKEKSLEAVYASCKLPERPPEKPIKDLLMKCIEAHYGKVEGFEEKDWAITKLQEIDKLLLSCRNGLYS